MTSITSPESVEYLYFTDGNTQITADYLKISKVSKQISSIKWDDNERKEISIQNILPLKYINCNLEAALKWVVSTIETEDKLGIEVANLSGIYCVKESLESLKILLLTVLWLDIDSMLDEILTTLHFYSLKLVDIIPYIQIYDDILRCHKEKAFQNILSAFLNHNYILSEDNIQIINDVIQCDKLDTCHRYQLALKYQLSYPSDVVTDQVTARRLYSLGIQSPCISSEIPAIEETKLILADSITKYNLAIRIGKSACIGTSNNTSASASRYGLFWFYVQGIDYHLINVGDVDIAGVKYQIIIREKDDYLLSVSDLQEGINMITKDEDCQNFTVETNTQKYEAYDESDEANYDVYYVLQHHDTKYRRHLHSLGLLTQIELSFLKKRDTLTRMYHRIRVYLQNKGNRQDSKFIDLELKYKSKIHKLRCLESKYYTSENGVKIENQRDHIYKQFKSSQYDGILILLNMINVIKIDHQAKYITIEKSRFNCTYYTHLLPSLNDIKTQDELLTRLPIHKVRVYVNGGNGNDGHKYVYHILGGIELNTYNIINNNYFYFDNGSPATDNYYFDIDDIRYGDESYPNINLNTFYMVDPSTVLNIEDIIEKSDPYCSLINHPRLVIAFPHTRPKIYFKAGPPDTIAITNNHGSDNIEGVNVSPYIHYAYDDSGKMTKVFRSNNTVSQEFLIST